MGRLHTVSTIVTLQDGRVLDGIPEGTSKEDIVSRFGLTPEDFAGATVRQVPAVAQPMQQQMDQANQAVVPDDAFSPWQTVKNLPGSVVDLGTDMVQPFLHPVETGKALASMIRGGISKAAGWDDPDEAVVEAVGDYYADRYGGVDQALKTLQDDPAGFLADLSMTGGVLAKVGGSSKLATAARAADPANMMLNTGAEVLKRVTSPGTPLSLYESAAKIPRGVRRPQWKIDRQMTTALDENIMPTARGLDRLNDTVESLDAEVTSLIQSADAAGQTVPKNSLFRYLSETRDEFGGATNLNATRDLRAIENVVSEYNQFLEQQNISRLNPVELQDLKQRTYKQIDFDRSQQKSNDAADAARKAIARAAKEDIEQLVPGNQIRDLNAREGRLLDLKPSLEQAASRIERRDLIGIGMPMKAMAGSQMGGPTGGILGWMSGVADAPKPKSAMAIGLHNLQQQGLMDTMGQGRLMTPQRQGLMEMGQLYQNEQERQQPPGFGLMSAPPNW